MLKKCTICNTEKDLELFEKDKRKPDLHSNRCLDCAREIKRVSAAKHHDERIERQRKYREEHPEEYKAERQAEYLRNEGTYREYRKQYYENNKEWYLQMCKDYRDTHKEQKSVKDKIYRDNHKEDMREYKRIYYQNNKSYISAANREYRTFRKQVDMGFHICTNIRERIRFAVVSCGGSKQHTNMLIGCTIPQYREYLESLFVDSMSWDNYGEWHIDHIRPCASFNLTDPVQQYFCFNYRNTQPMWKVDNMRKHDRWNPQDREQWYSQIYPNIKADILLRNIIDSSYEGC